MSLRLAEAQNLCEAVRDPMLKPALEEFFEAQRKAALELLVQAVRQSVRDPMKEASLAGRVAAYESAMNDLDRFAVEQFNEATG